MRFEKKEKKFFSLIVIYIILAIALILFFQLINYFGIYNFGIGIGIALLAILIALKLTFPNLFRKENVDFMLGVSNIIFAFFIFLTFYISYQTYDLTYRNSLPKLNIQLRSYDVPWGEFGEESDYYLPLNEFNKTSIKLPVFLTVNNYGQVPNQVYNVHFETNCGRGTNGLLSIPKNASTLIKPGEFFEMYDEIWVPTNRSIKLPCEVKFKVYNTYFDPIEKRIIIKNPRISKNQ